MVPFQSLCNLMNQHKVTIQNKVFLHQLIFSHFWSRWFLLRFAQLGLQFFVPFSSYSLGYTPPPRIPVSHQDHYQISSKGSQYTYIFTAATVTGIGSPPRFSTIWPPMFVEGPRTNPGTQCLEEKKNCIYLPWQTSVGGESPGSSGFAIYMSPSKHKKKTEGYFSRGFAKKAV